MLVTSEQFSFRDTYTHIHVHLHTVYMYMYITLYTVHTCTHVSATVVTRALKCKPSAEKQCTPCTTDKDVDLCMEIEA